MFTGLGESDWPSNEPQLSNQYTNASAKTDTFFYLANKCLDIIIIIVITLQMRVWRVSCLNFPPVGDPSILSIGALFSLIEEAGLECQVCINAARSPRSRLFHLSNILNIVD